MGEEHEKVPGGASSIKAQGTLDCPVHFTSDETAPGAGDWSGIDIYADSSNDGTLTCNDLKDAGGDGYGATCREGGARVNLVNVTFSDDEPCVSGDGTPGVTNTSFQACP